ncbi:MAG TPA: serine hydrolase [Haliscomenobacter sp.]|uniref:serine hydrolase domain-containing protein n=1 Tax=Haliscomenobacter sp. TaxID=2717303 RepID=UPI002C1965CB|nr:serine hydrolase [Haliscomenobacter sp.]HOY20773.1 serine hydrolase [Haliscomenobacter sp.]
MRYHLLFFLLLVPTIFVFSQSKPAQSPQLATAKKFKTLDSLLQTEVNGDKIPGAVIQVKKGKQVLFQRAYGLSQKYNAQHQLLPNPEPSTLEHLYDLASLTKVVGTTTAIMLLVDQEQIGLEDPVGKYIHAFDTPEKSKITIRYLLSHSAGLREWYPLYYRASNKQETYRLIGELPLAFPVGKQRRYSDLGFVLLGQIIEQVSKMPLEQFLDQQVFKPLGMLHTTYNPLSKGGFTKIAATSHGNPYEKRMVYDASLGFTVKDLDPKQWDGWRNYTLKGEVNDGNTWYANGGISGAAGLFSTVGDLQKLVDMLLAKGKVGERKFVSAQTVEQFLTKDQFNNGLGWMMDPSNPVMKNAPAGTFAHTGFTGTSIVVVPQANISVIVLINRQNMGLSGKGAYYDLGPLRQKLIAAVLKL